MNYYTTTSPTGTAVIILLEGNVMTSFTENPEITDYQAYLAWVAAGGVPEPWPTS